MAELRRGPGGRPMDHQLRVVMDAVRYVVKYGVQWRALPADYPDWQAVYVFYERWNARGLPQNLVDRLRARLRGRAGRADLPTAAVIDSQSVKTADTVGAATSGPWSSAPTTSPGSLWCPTGGWSSAHSAGWPATGAWSTTTNGDLSITRPWCCGPPR
jgi:transposase